MILSQSCISKKSTTEETPENGTIQISVDESFRPVMEEQIKMYELSYPNAHIEVVYKSEADCMRDFFKDSATRLVIVGRGLSKKEERFMIDSIGYNPPCNRVATDAVAIILNPSNIDTTLTLDQIEKGLLGHDEKKYLYVFDGLNATSTVRYIKDSILKGNKYDTSMVRATKNSEEVIEYVANHKNAIGFLGISWIGNEQDPNQIQRLKKIRLAYIQNLNCTGEPFVKPTQESMITRRYPLTRPLYYIMKENFTGVGSGFVSFLKYERGQLIFKRDYLAPVMDFEVRNIQINETGAKK